MAEGPRRPGQGLPPSSSASSPRTTQPRVSAVTSSDRPLSRGAGAKGNERVIADVEDPTTTMDPLDQTARQKFVNPEDLRTAIVPQRGRVGTPLSTAVTTPQRTGPSQSQSQSHSHSGGSSPYESSPSPAGSPGQSQQSQQSQQSGQSQQSPPSAAAGRTATTPPRQTPARGLAADPTPKMPSMVSALAASGSTIAITEKSMPAATMPMTPAAPLVETSPRTQVWVATHKVPEDPDERLILLRDPDSARSASFRVLRHRLQERGDPRVIAVTSAREKEGKTTCAVNLALALGECGRARVLLVEANLRSPALAPLFGFMPPECFSTQLQRHKEKPEDAWSVVEVYSPSLHVLAVRPDGGPRPLLDGPAFRIAIEMLIQAGYDYIVIDTSPVLGAADVNLVEDSADGVLFVALAGSTPATALRQAVEQLQPGKLLGITLLDA